MYDNLAGSGDYTDAYIYDLTGNRSRFTHNGTAKYYFCNDKDRLLKETSDATGNNVLVDYEYDKNGSMVYKNDHVQTKEYVYTYNLQGKLGSMQLYYPPFTETIYKYDPDGIRVQKDVGYGTTTTNYLIDPSNPTGYAQVLKESTTEAQPIVYVIGSDIVAQSTGTSTPAYMLYDGHGSVRFLANNSGTLISGQTFNYDAYGNITNSVTPATALLYSGEMRDFDLGLDYLRSRWYDPPTGRLISPDTYPGNNSDPASLHRYLYCNANPINGTDPSGNMSLAEGLTVGAVLNAILTMQFFPNIANGPSIGDIESGNVYKDAGGQAILALPAEVGGLLFGRYVIAPTAKFLVGKLKGAFSGAARSAIGKASADASVTINARTSKLIAEGPGVNVTPKSVIDNANYLTIGSKGRTFITDAKAVEDIIGPLKGETITINVSQARQLENAIGLEKLLERENVITIVSDVASRSPASPIAGGNSLFRGPGKGLPSGGPELTITGVPTRDTSAGVSRIILRVAN